MSDSNLPAVPPLSSASQARRGAGKATHVPTAVVRLGDGPRPGSMQLGWVDGQGRQQQVLWAPENGAPPPKRVVLADDQFHADVAYKLACEGVGLLWTGDYHNARQLLQAMARRVDRALAKSVPATTPAGLTPGFPERFHLHRKTQAQRARILGLLLLPVEPDYRIALRRAPDIGVACAQAWGQPTGNGLTSWVSLREVQGLIGAHEWRKKGVPVAALGHSRDGHPRLIHPYYGVFSPIRGEYLTLLQQAAWPDAQPPATVFDIGTGSGVIAALLAARGASRVLATDLSEQALDCARANVAQLGLAERIEVQRANLFPAGRAALVVCNPPWLPGKPASLIEQGIYDPGSQMLRGFLAGLAEHLEPGGQGWLILSDLAERLQLRSRAELLGWMADAGLRVLDKADIQPQHPKSQDASDPLHLARSAEVTSLWRLVAARP